MTALVGTLSAVIVTAVVVAIAHFLTYGELRVDRGSRWVCVAVMALVAACLAVSLGTMEWGRLVLAFGAGLAAGPVGLLVALQVCDWGYARRMRALFKPSAMSHFSASNDALNWDTGEGGGAL